MLVIAVFIHTVWFSVAGAEVNEIVFAEVTVTVICTGVPAHPAELVSITWRVQVPAFSHVTDVRFEFPGAIVPLPPVKGIMLQT